MKLGVYAGLSNDEYHSGEGVSKSQLDLVNGAPGLMKWSKGAPEHHEDSDASNIGTALHSMILEPHLFDEQYVVAPDVDKRTTSGKVEWANFEASIEGLDRQIITSKDWDKLRYMRDSVMAHPDANALLSAPKGRAEHSVYWIDEETGILCRCRPDWWPSPRIILDVKSTEKADSYNFSKSIADYRYHVQDAFYTDGVSAATGRQVEHFFFLAIGKTRAMGKYPVHLFELDPEDKHQGRIDYKKNLRTVLQCQNEDNWPGIESIRLPAYARTNQNQYSEYEQ